MQHSSSTSARERCFHSSCVSSPMQAIEGAHAALAATRSGEWAIEIVQRNELHTFVVLPKRWIVERTIAVAQPMPKSCQGLGEFNRKALAFLRLASIRLMLRKLCNPA